MTTQDEVQYLMRARIYFQDCDTCDIVLDEDFTTSSIEEVIERMRCIKQDEALHPLDWGLSDMWLVPVVRGDDGWETPPHERYERPS